MDQGMQEQIQDVLERYLSKPTAEAAAREIVGLGLPPEAKVDVWKATLSVAAQGGDPCAATNGLIAAWKALIKS